MAKILSTVSMLLFGASISTTRSGCFVVGFAPHLHGRLIHSKPPALKVAGSPFLTPSNTGESCWTTLERAYGDVSTPPNLLLPEIEKEHNTQMYADCEDMLILSMLMYEYAALRKYARDHGYMQLQKELEPPKTAKDLLPVLDKNLHYIGIKPEDIDNRKELASKFLDDVTSLRFGKAKERVNEIIEDQAQEQYNKQSEEAIETRKMLTESFVQRDGLQDKDRFLVHFHDTKKQVRSSCVHAVTVNRSLRRVDVIFRGTENGTWKNMWHDWTSNINMGWRTIPNPVVDSTIPRVSVHNGFATSLLGYRYKREEFNTLQEIFQEVEPYVMGDGYRLFVTGHSMGAAVATLLAFYAAADSRFTEHGPVMLYTYASPRLGDSSFRSTFKQLEEQGKIRHTRIHNNKDQAAKVPSFGFGYRHVGMEVRLRSKDVPVLDYPVGLNWRQARTRAWDIFSDVWGMLRHHSCPEMMVRLKRADCVLENTSVENEYRRMWNAPLIEPYTGGAA